MDPFSNTPDIILDLVLLKLSEEDLHETLRVSKSWFWASIRRIKKLKITRLYNPLKSMVEFYNNHRPPTEEAIVWCDLFKYLVLDELVVSYDNETVNYLVKNGCNTAGLTIENSEEETPMTLASLKNFTRLQYLEYCTVMEWCPFIAECLKSSNCELDPNNECPIENIKFNSSGWKTEDPVLKSVTKLGLRYVPIDFLRTLIDLCPNLEELHIAERVITQNWHQVFPSNVKRIELHDMKLTRNVARVVNASTDSARHLLPYLCQNWESAEIFHYDGRIGLTEKTVYKACPQQREEILDCAFVNDDMNLAAPLFQNREINVRCDGRRALQLNIPPTKIVKLEFDYHNDSYFKFSLGEVCVEPGKVEYLSLSLYYANGVTPEPFKPSSFEGFSRLTSLTFSRVSALTIRIALDQCPSIRKLELQYLKAFTIGSMPRRSTYANVCELVLDDCKETMRKVFQVFPRLLQFKCLDFFEVEQRRKKKADWLWRHLIEEGKRYGLVFEKSTEIRYMLSDDLETSLSQAQKLLNEYRHGESVAYLKGFKLIPRVSKQKVIYVD